MDFEMKTQLKAKIPALLHVCPAGEIRGFADPVVASEPYV